MAQVLLNPATAPDYADELLSLIVTGKKKVGHPREIDKWIAMRESDRTRLASLAGWEPDKKGPYRVDPLPERISVAFADFLWGEVPTITANVEEDQELLDPIVENNDLSEEFHFAEEIKSSEGQVWFRVYRDDEQFPYPVIEWHSRTEVIPHFRGKRLLAVAFVILVEERQTSDTTNEIYRRLEVYGPGVTYNALFKSATPGELGQRIALESHVDTVELLEEWRHGLPMLAGWIPNRRGRNANSGRSDYHGVEDFLLDLNETHAVDKANYRLSGRKRSVMPEKYRQADGSAEDADVYFAESDDEMEADAVFKILEYEYDGQASIDRKRDLANTILTRVGLARQLVDPNTEEGPAASGVSLKVRLIPQTATARGKGRPWDETAPTALMLAQMVDALEPQRNGFGRPWKAPNEPPAIERGSIIPEDPQEELQYHVDATSADLESLETAIAALHPDWDEVMVKDEVAKILDENARAAGFPSTFEETGEEELVPEEEFIEEPVA